MQFPTDPFPGSRDEVFFAVEALRCQFAVLGETVGADAEGVELVAVDVLSAAEGVGGRLLSLLGTGAARTTGSAGWAVM